MVCVSYIIEKKKNKILSSFCEEKKTFFKRTNKNKNLKMKKKKNLLNNYSVPFHVSKIFYEFFTFFMRLKKKIKKKNTKMKNKKQADIFPASKTKQKLARSM